MSIRELPAYAKRAIIRNAAEQHDELSGLDYVSNLLADCGATTTMHFHCYRELVDALRARESLMPGEDAIPGGYESRAEADISAETWASNIETYLARLVPDDGIPVARVRYNTGTGEWVADVRLVWAS